MGLSEEELRALRALEASMAQDDPDFVARASYGAQRRRLAVIAGLWSIGLVAAFIGLLFTYASHPAIGLLMFVIMVSCGLMIARNVHRLGSVAVGDALDAARTKFSQLEESRQEFLREMERRRREDGQ